MIEIVNEKYLKIDEINLIKTNSQDINPGDIFVAINNGNNYVEQALKSGAKYVICERENLNDERIISVKNSLETFTAIAKQYRKVINPKVIAITGSNGKTSVKDILAQCLCKKFRIHKTAGNFNNHIGVPITICSMPIDTEILITELGMSGFGEIDHLASIVLPDIGIITNIGESHLEMLKTKENVLKAKAEITPYCKLVILNLDDPYLRTLKGEYKYFSIDNDSSFMALDICKEMLSTKFIISKSRQSVISNLMGIHNVYNVLAALRVCDVLGELNEEVISSVSRIQISKMRMERIPFHGGIVINDAYNASPKSTLSAIETICEYFKEQKKIFVLGDMLELGEEESIYHEEIIKKVILCQIHKAFFYGEIYNSLKEKYQNDFMIFSQDKDLIKKELIKEMEPNCVALLKASRGKKLEELLK